jgi:hypothetical protein
MTAGQALRTAVVFAVIAAIGTILALAGTDGMRTFGVSLAWGCGVSAGVALLLVCIIPVPAPGDTDTTR